MNHSENNQVAYFPITLFGSIMGYSGLTLAFQKAHELLGISVHVFHTLAFLTLLFFTAISATYLIKILKHSQAAIDEFNHPVALHFFPTFSISLLLMSLIFKDISFELAQFMWGLGAFIQFGLLLYILNNWIHHEKWQITQMNPAWFIPVVGTIVIPIGSVHFANIELGWFFFSIGLVFWILLNSIVMYRLFFHHPMLKMLEPTLFIFIAPPAVGFISYMSLEGMGGVNEFARILYYIGLFLTILLLSQLPRFIRVPFSLSWWAYSFPLAAITIASFIMYEQLELEIFNLISSFLLALLSALILHLTIKTFMAIKNKKLCAPSPKPSGE
ncbi:MAG TPA: C4-dicarboxylate ABC transporter [Thiomicrospira sp.]|jgi:tellurite resistance protein|nr:C4-dicarboxylate ABC transporter [Thiomicrospira sp.]